MKLRKSRKIKNRRIALKLKPKVTSILIKRIIIFLAMAIVSGISTGAVLTNPLISTGSTWRYMNDGSDQGTAWRHIDFGDSFWSFGPAQPGCGDGDEATFVDCGSNASNKYITTFFRHAFQVFDPAVYRALLLKVPRDDIYYDTLADSVIFGDDESTLYEFSVDGRLLQIGKNVAAVEIHQSNVSSSDISFDLQLQLDVSETATLLKGPYLIYPGVNTEMIVLWQLDNSAACTIEWGRDTSYDDGTAITFEYGSDHQHKYSITDLIPGEKYFYRIINGANEYTGSFHAAPPDNAQNVKFLAYGDTRSYPSIHDSVAAGMIGTYTDDPAYQTFVLHTGDWVNHGDNELDWADQFFPQNLHNLRELIANVPLNGCKGNHEESGDLFYKYWPYPYENDFYWSFDFGPVHVVVVDQYVPYWQGSTQYNWLNNDLAMTTKPWKIIILHEPGWSAGGGHENNSVVQDDIQPLCETYGVDIVFAGHNHYYAHADVNGVQHITAGGGGAPLHTPDSSYPYVVTAEKTHHFCEIEIQEEALYFKARNPEGSLIDAFSLNIHCKADFNNDGKVDNSDLEIFSFAMGKIDCTLWPDLCVCDTDYDKDVDGEDLAELVVEFGRMDCPLVFETRVSASSDDAEEAESGSMYLTSSDLELVFDDNQDQGDQTVGMRFNGVEIPPEAAILNAYIQFQADEPSSEETSLLIQGEDVDDAQTFSYSYQNVSSRARTSASQQWWPVEWATVGATGYSQRTPNLSSIMKEIMDRPGWSSGNALAIIITGYGQRIAESFDGDPAGAPLLHIKYTLPLGSE